jgi:4-aminobutyrate--pyruvate transaminase
VKDLETADVVHLIHPFTDLERYHCTGPTIIDSGRGVMVTDSKGRRYIDALAGLWSTSLGFGVEELADAAAAQMRQLGSYHLVSRKSTRPVIRLAEKLVALSPPGLSKVFFVNSGSEANDTQIKLLWYFNNAHGRPRKKKIICRVNGYHGSTLAAASLSSMSAYHSGFDLPMPFVRFTSCPSRFHHAEPGESDEEFSTRLAAELEELIVREDPDTVAALFVEPVMGAGGVLPPPAGYFAKIQAVLRRYDVRLVNDEVICGFGRTGRMWGADTYGITADSMSCAKALASGYMPIGAVVVDEPMYEAMRGQSRTHGSFGHGFTYGGHPVAAAVALRAITLMEERDVLGHVARVAPHFHRRLGELAGHPLVGDARGAGLLGGLHLVAGKEPRRPLPPGNGVAAYCVERAEEHGLICRGLGDVIALCPPLVIDEEEIDMVFDRLRKALDETHTWASADGLLH